MGREASCKWLAGPYPGFSFDLHLALRGPPPSWPSVGGAQGADKLQYSSEIIGEGVRIRSMHDCMMQASYGFIRFEAIVLVKCDGGGPKWKTGLSLRHCVRDLDLGKFTYVHDLGDAWQTPEV